METRPVNLDIVTTMDTSKSSVMDISSLSDAENILIKIAGDDILDEIYNFMQNWKFHSNNTKISMEHLISDIRKQFFETETKINLYYAINCYAYNIFHSSIYLTIKETFSEKDLNFYNVCLELSSKNICAADFDSNINYAINLPAAISELSIIENYSSPIEKLNCICNTYDLLYAELKAILVTAISKYSDNENDIPIINKNEIIPSLMVVIIKSKLMYIFSNLNYIKYISDKVIENQEKGSILNCFEEAVNRVETLNKQTIEKYSDKIETNMNACEQMEFISKIEQEKLNFSYVNEERKRIAGLIRKSTEENLHI